MSNWEIHEVGEDDHDEVVRLLTVLNPDYSEDIIRERYETILKDHPHYTAYGGYLDGKLIAVVGGWIATKVWCGRYLEIDNIIVDPDVRSEGYGSRLCEHLFEVAKEKKCELVVLDSYVSNQASHRLYHRLGMTIYGYHFGKKL